MTRDFYIPTADDIGENAPLIDIPGADHVTIPRWRYDRMIYAMRYARNSLAENKLIGNAYRELDAILTIEGRS